LARNNSGRTKTAKTKKTEEAETPPPVKKSVLDFVTPTEFVELPSAGRFYDTSHPLHRQETVEIRFMTAKDEDILTSQTLLRKGMALEKFLQNVLIDKSINPASLLIGDRNAILVAARVTGYGPNYETNTPCPACGNKSVFAFNLNDGSVYGGDDLGDLEIDETDRGTFITTLPMTKISAEFRLLTGEDESFIARNNARRKKASALETNLTTQLARCIVGLNDDTDKSIINQFVELMPAFDSRHMRSAIKAVTPNIDLTQHYQCSECNHEQEMEVPFTTDFFWPNR
jgi:hypothetical protein|tara:strand:+ start:25 stop:882 length:858 start_codon:yes stop_codon:yes gene_type:complete